MRGIEGEQALLHIVLGTPKAGDSRRLVRAILELLRADGLAGASVLKGIAGFGHDRQLHTIDVEVAARDLPVVIEVVDTLERVESVVPKLEALMAGGLVTVERAHVIRYSGSPGPSRS